MLCCKNWLVAGLLIASTVAAIVPQVDAGPLGGPKYSVHRVAARSTDVFHVTFRAGEEAVVLVDGDRDTDLDLYVYDQYGNLVAFDTDRTDTCVAHFVPRWTGSFRIEVRNLGTVYNQYEIGAA